MSSSGDWIAKIQRFHIPTHLRKQSRNKKCRRASSPAGSSSKLISSLTQKLRCIWHFGIHLKKRWFCFLGGELTGRGCRGAWLFGLFHSPDKVHALVRRLNSKNTTFPHSRAFKEENQQQKESSGEFNATISPSDGLKKQEILTPEKSPNRKNSLISHWAVWRVNHYPSHKSPKSRHLNPVSTIRN